MTQTIVGSITVLVAACLGALAVQGSDAPQNFEKWSREDLVSELRIEHKRAPESGSEAVSYHRYDRVVAEILRRRDLDMVPMLLKLANEDTVVVFHDYRDQPLLSWYDTPILLKYKARFTLQRLLEAESYRSLIHDSYDSRINIEKALEYFSKHKDQIRLRPSRELPEDQIIRIP